MTIALPEQNLRNQIEVELAIPTISRLSAIMGQGRLRFTRVVKVAHAFNEQKAAYVVHGGLAATLLGMPKEPLDLDVFVDDRRDNFGRVASALNSIPVVNTGSSTFPKKVRPARASDFRKVRSEYGDETQNLEIHVRRSVKGEPSFTELSRDATEFELRAGVTVLVPSIDHLIVQKELTVGKINDADSKQKHRRNLETLYVLRSVLTGCDYEADLRYLPPVIGRHWDYEPALTDHGPTADVGLS